MVASTLFKIARRKLSRLLWGHTSLTIGRFTLRCTKGHPLRYYVQDFPLYDRFLAHLCQSLPSQTTVVDIGANIGDTAAQILNGNDQLRCISAEPDPIFFGILEENAQAISATVPRCDIQPVQAFIHDEPSEALALTKNRTESTARPHLSTAGAVESAVPTWTFAQLVEECSLTDIRLVKIDTDGHDHAVLRSLSAYLASDDLAAEPLSALPLVFFEFMPYEDALGYSDPGRYERTENYLVALRRLLGLGYHQYVIFDNFGAPLLRGNSLDTIASVLEYLHHSQITNRRSTIPLFDILLFTDVDADLVSDALSRHTTSEDDSGMKH